MPAETTTLRVDFISESAAFRNTFGWYNSRTGQGGILFAGIEAQGSNPSVIPGVSYAEISVATADLNNIQFFLIPDGDNIRKNTDDELSGPIKVIRLDDGTWAVATVDDHGNVETDGHGRPNILYGEGANALFTETSKNAGRVDYASSTVGPNQTATTLGGDTVDGPTGLIAWEDIAATRRPNGTFTKPGDADYNDAVFKVSIANHAPVAVADSNAGDPVVESGVGPGNAPFAGDPSATGNALANDTDADGNTLTVVGIAAGSVSGPVSGNVGATLTGTYGTLALNADGVWTYTLNNADTDTNALAKAEAASDVFTYTAWDGHGGTATTTLTINISGTNDAPVITGTTAGAVKEDVTRTTSGQLNATDPDHGAQQTWTVAGGTPGHDADFRFELDNLLVIRNGSVFFNDTFNDGVPPPDGPNGPATYGLGDGETMLEQNGRVVLTDEGGIQGISPGSHDPFISNTAVLRTNIDPANLQQGLKIDDDFTVEGIFDLDVPDDNREAYGIRLRDRVVGGNGTPPDQLGDDVIELLVHKTASGVVRVDLREKDFVADEVNLIQRLDFAPPAGADQIRLRLAHDADNPGTIIASFDYLAGGVVVGSQTFTEVGKIFGTETPGNTSDDENWTRVEFVAWSPEVTAANKLGTYGTLSVEQDGSWTYALNNASTALQSLAEGQTDKDTFQVTVTDEHGATDTETVSVTVTGTNDAPTIVSNSSVTRDLAEDATSPDLTASGLTFFNDVDLVDTHTITPSLTSAVLSSGSAIPPTLAAALQTAIATSLLDPATGDGSGQYQWDFSVPNDLVQFLPEGEMLTATYAIAVTDNHGLTAIQTVTINIAGTNDAPVITSGPGSGSVTENLVASATGTMDAFDPDRGAQEFWTVSGGSAAAPADYHFLMDDFKITKNGSLFFEDPFSDGLPPPDSPFFANGNPHAYGGNGGFQEAGGKLIIDSSDADPGISVGTTDPFISNTALVRSNIDPSNLAAGLKSDDNFAVEGLFDLIIPDSPREVYGIRLTDRLVGGSGTPPDQLGDDRIELLVRLGVDGIVRVQLRENDVVNDQITNIQGIVLNPPANADQILLRLTHSTTDVGALHASFDYLAGGVVVGSESFTAVGRIFGTETPSFTGDDENWTRAEIVAYAPAIADSTLEGAYGSLTIDQTGGWTYSLANNKLAVQNLAAGETKTDTFTVQVADEHGASDTEVINITVTGSNDAPVVATGDVSRTLAEDSASPNLTATGDAFFSDVDLSDTHTVLPSLASAALSDGASVPLDVQAAAQSAMSATIIDPATGDSDGHYRWDFALDNALVQFLAEGQSLDLVYNVATTDNHAASDMQQVTIHITGVDEPHLLL